MPNWCLNQLKIEGNKNRVAEFFDFIKGDTPSEDNGEILLFDFNKIFPMPLELNVASPPNTAEDKNKAASNLAKYGFETWYEWKKANWGTKWNVGSDDTEITNEPDINNYSISFTTAWTPASGIVKKLGELFPDLEFTLHYFEPGAGFAGCLTVSGEEINDEYSEDQETIEQIGRDIFCMDDFFEDDEDSEDE